MSPSTCHHLRSDWRVPNFRPAKYTVWPALRDAQTRNTIDSCLQASDQHGRRKPGKGPCWKTWSDELDTEVRQARGYGDLRWGTQEVGSIESSEETRFKLNRAWSSRTARIFNASHFNGLVDCAGRYPGFSPSRFEKSWESYTGILRFLPYGISSNLTSLGNATAEATNQQFS